MTWNWIAEEKTYYAKDSRKDEMETVSSWILTADDVIHLYPVVFGKKLLVSKKETFLGSPDIISETAYLYNKDGYLKAESFVNSSGEKIENEYRYPNDYIFTSQKGSVYSVQRINVVFKEIRVKYSLKIKNFSTHSCRKSFGRAVYNNAGSNAELALVKLSELFNHSDVRTTRKYLGLRNEELMEAYDLLSF